jgi:DUF4097 and DUF4098 domain-containing protein YvlB
MTREILIGALTGMAALMVAGTAAPARADEWSKTYPISARADLHVSTDDGNVTIASADQKQVDARVITEGFRIGPHDVRIEESQSGDHITVNVRLPHWNFGLFGGSRKSVRVELRVPLELDLDVHTGDGNISAQASSGRIHMDTGDGNITMNGLKGDVSMHTGDGNIDGSNLDGSLNVDTGDGHLTVRGRFDALNLKSGDGNINVEATSGSKIASGWALYTGDGRINLRVPADFKANIDAHTGDGSITLDIPISVEGSLSHSSIRGKMNGGGGDLRLRTGDGSITLEKL